MPEIRKEATSVKAAEFTTDKMRNQHQSKVVLSKRIGLITAMGQFRPKNATPIQFYNFVREFCIMHNCSIDEAMERAPVSWKKLSKDQRQLYNSEVHAALPIPVPQHLVYRAFQMERAGRWKLSSARAGKSGNIMYSMESYAPPTKPTRMQTRIRSQYPRFDNLAESSPCFLESPRHNTTPKKFRTITPLQAQPEKISPTCILSEVSLKGVLNNNGIKKSVKSKSKKLIRDDKKKSSKTELKKTHLNKENKKKF